MGRPAKMFTQVPINVLLSFSKKINSKCDYHWFIELASGEVIIEKDCITDMFCKENCHDGCHTETSMEGLTNTTCICKTDLCNGSPILSVNYSIIGILVLFYFLK